MKPHGRCDQGRSPSDAGVLVGSGVGEVGHLAGLAADEAVKVGALQSLARCINEMALRALDLEDLGTSRVSRRRKRNEELMAEIPWLPWRHLQREQ